MDSSAARDDALLLTVSKCDRHCSCVSVSLFHTRSDMLELIRRFRYLFGGSDRQPCSSPHSQLLPGNSANSTSHLAFALEVREVKKHDNIGRHVVCSAKGIRRSAILYGVPRCSSDTGIYTRSRCESMARNPCNGTCDEALYRMSRTGRNNLGGLT